jgi:hypothetical protein
MGDIGGIQEILVGIIGVILIPIAEFNFYIKLFKNHYLVISKTLKKYNSDGT